MGMRWRAEQGRPAPAFPCLLISRHARGMVAELVGIAVGFEQEGRALTPGPSFLQPGPSSSFNMKNRKEG